MGYPPQNQYPYQYPYPNMAAPPPAKKRSCCLSCLLSAVIGVLALVVLGMGVYLLFKNGVVTERQVLALVGKVPGEVNIINLLDEPLDVTLNPLDSSQSNTFTVGNGLNLQPMDVDGFTMDAGGYELSFSSSSTPTSVCTLKIASNDYLRFAVSGSGIIVTSDAHPSKTDADLRIETSPLCHP